MTSHQQSGFDGSPRQRCKDLQRQQEKQGWRWRSSDVGGEMLLSFHCFFLLLDAVT